MHDALGGFPPLDAFKEAADRVMDLVADTDALIVDVRDNGGGVPASVGYLVSSFLDASQPVLINRIIWREKGTQQFRTEESWSLKTPYPYGTKPVYILSSPNTFSGGEEFAYDLQSLKRAKIVGGITRGGANPGDVVSIGDSFAMFLPAGRAENPVTGTSWEGIGVQPDIVAEPKHALSAAMSAISADVKPNEGALRQVGDADLSKWLDRSMLSPKSEPDEGGEAAIRRLVEEAITQKPDYDLLSPIMADATREQLPFLHEQFSKLGAVKSMRFLRAKMGGDVFSVEHENGNSEWTVRVRGGKVMMAMFKAL